MKLIEHKKITDCVELQLFSMQDERGEFIKPFNSSQLSEIIGKSISINESITSISKKYVLRGMHFQIPPYSQYKLVTCLSGSFLDVFLDLRPSSKTFGSYDSVILSSKQYNAILLPPGIAHGIQALEDDSRILYYTDVEYDPFSDQAIKYDSFDCEQWDLENVIVSQKDQNAITLNQFIKNNPFN